MSELSGPPFRADHVGSLLRPPELLRARGEHQAGRLSAEELRRVEDDAIRDAVRMQEEIGLEGVTDGEFRRGSWHMDFIYQIGGVTRAEQRLNIQFRNEGGTVEFHPTAHRVSGKLKLEKTIFGEDFSFLKSVTKAIPKLTIPSPSMVHYRGGRAAIDEGVYPDMEGFWHDIAAVYSEEIGRLHRLGCTYLQLDDTSLAYLNDPAQRAYVTSIGGDGDTQHLTNIRVINTVLANRPAGMTVCTHLCRGNFRSSWMAEGDGIRINTVHPGVIDTPIWTKISSSAGRNTPIDPNEVSKSGVPLGRVGQAQDIANGVLFLASDASSYMTGAEVMIDGGMTGGAVRRWS